MHCIPFDQQQCCRDERNFLLDLQEGEQMSREMTLASPSSVQSVLIMFLIMTLFKIETIVGMEFYKELI